MHVKRRTRLLICVVQYKECSCLLACADGESAGHGCNIRRRVKHRVLERQKKNLPAKYRISHTILDHEGLPGAAGVVQAVAIERGWVREGRSNQTDQGMAAWNTAHGDPSKSKATQSPLMQATHRPLMQTTQRRMKRYWGLQSWWR